MTDLVALLHAARIGLFRKSPYRVALDIYNALVARFEDLGLNKPNIRAFLIEKIAEDIRDAFGGGLPEPIDESLTGFVTAIFDHEELFKLPAFEWNAKHSVTEYWEMRSLCERQLKLADDFNGTVTMLLAFVTHSLQPLVAGTPRITAAMKRSGTIVMPTRFIDAVSNLPQALDLIAIAVLNEDLKERDVLPRTRGRLEFNTIVASGGNPAKLDEFNKLPKSPSQSDIKDPVQLLGTYFNGTPLTLLFNGMMGFHIPTEVRFEHHHIVAGSGHGKTQTLQYLIASDLVAVAEGKRSVIVIDSQGDLIHKLARLKAFAPGGPLHDRVVLIDPTDVEWPVSLNLFDVGLDRLGRYSQLDRERLTNSIIELYDFVLGSLLSAEMTQKQNVIFRYVTRLMLQIPNATIHTLRELMEPKSEEKFADAIGRLTGTAKRFFETEFSSSEFTQTRKQVLRRLWGILENQTFERMFSHPRSKLDLFAEMNAGKVILINTAKELLKETGTEIFGRFFIALIVQAAQERATLREADRMPTIVYIDEAADYFDKNIGIILAQARKYKVGMVLAHQYLGQLDQKLQEAFAANTSIKFAGGVSNRDSRSLAQMMYAPPEFLETQPKGSFAAYIRGLTNAAISLQFPLGHLERLPKMDHDEWFELRARMRKQYAVRFAEDEPLDDDEPDAEGDPEEEPTAPEHEVPKQPKPRAGNDDDPNKPSSEW